MGRTGLGFWSNIEGRQGLRLASRPLPYKAYRAIVTALAALRIVLLVILSDT
jgi:hypothetical protein